MTNESWLEDIFQGMQVDSIKGCLFHCEKEWKLNERVIGDDMFFFVIKGHGRVTVEDRVYPMRPGDCAHFRRKIRHSGSHDPKNPIDVITLHYNATVLQSLTLAELLGFPDLFPRIGHGPLEKYFHVAACESDGQEVGRNRALEAIVMRLLLHLVRTTRYRESMKIEYQEARHHDLLRLRAALQRMSEDLSKPEPIEELARLCGLSTAQFGKVFSRSLRMSPIHYLRRLRVTRACWLLRNTSQSIEMIGDAVGYRETSFFAHTFKKLMGVSPGSYRCSVGP